MDSAHRESIARRFPSVRLDSPEYLAEVARLVALPREVDPDYVAALGAPEVAARHRAQCESSAAFYLHTAPQLAAQGYRHGNGREPGAHVAWVEVDGTALDLWVVKLTP